MGVKTNVFLACENREEQRGRFIKSLSVPGLKDLGRFHGLRGSLLRTASRWLCYTVR